MQPASLNTAAAVITRQLTKIYSQGDIEVAALDGIDLSIDTGDFVALMGPSGSGKSTLLHLIAGVDRATSGSCEVLGTNLAALSESDLAEWRTKTVGFIFQSFNLVPVLTAFENVELPLILTGLSSARRRILADTALDLVGLADRSHHLPRQLSGGQEQRVAIARAIVTDPPLLVADEPTGSLDAKSAEDVLSILQALRTEGGKTVIMVTHDPKAASHARRMIHLEKGQIVPDEASSYEPYVVHS